MLTRVLVSARSSAATLRFSGAFRRVAHRSIIRHRTSGSGLAITTPQVQHSSWLRRFLYVATSVTTVSMLAANYRDTFDVVETGSLLDSESDTLANGVRSDSMPQDDEQQAPVLEQKDPADYEQAFELVLAIEDLVDIGGTTLYSVREKDGTRVLEEVSQSSAKYYPLVVQNSVVFREKMLELKSLSGEFFPFLAQLVIDKATSRASYSLLKVLDEEQFGIQELLVGNPVLNHPKAELIESYLDKFHKLGLLEHMHMPLILAIQEAQALEGEEELARLELLPLDPSDEIMVMQAFLSSQEQLRSANGKVKSDFARTVVLPASYSYSESPYVDGAEAFSTEVGDYNPFLEGATKPVQPQYDRFFRSLKEEAEKLDSPVDAQGILTGTHYTCFNTQVEKEPNGTYTVRLLYVDTMPLDISSFNGSNLVPAIKRVFGDDVNIELHSSVEYTQSRGVGCSYHAPFITERLRELPEWLAQNEEEYAKMPANRRIWAYLNTQGHTFESETVIQYFEDTDEYQQEKLRVKPKVEKFTWKGITLPLHVTAENKESFSRETNVSDEWPVRRGDDFPYRVTAKEKLGDILAQQGLVVNLGEHSPRAHQQELPTRVYPYLDVKFKDALDGKTKLVIKERKDGSVYMKRINRGVDAYRERLRKDLMEYMLFKASPEDLDRLTERHTLDEFELRVCERNMTKAESLHKSFRHTFFAMMNEGKEKPKGPSSNPRP